MDTATQKSVHKATNQSMIQTAILPDSVQAMLPMLTRLDVEQKMTLIHLLTTSKNDVQMNENTLSKPSQTSKEPSPLDRKYLGEVWMSDDFNDHLGDEFWLGKDA